MIFTNQKYKVDHKISCIFNPAIEVNNPVIEVNKIMDNFDKLRVLKEQFPKLYDLLSSQQIKEFLDNDMTGYKKVNI